MIKHHFITLQCKCRQPEIMQIDCLCFTGATQSNYFFSACDNRPTAVVLIGVNDSACSLAEISPSQNHTP